MAGRLLDDDPTAAFAHAWAARRRAARVGLVREAAGIAAYHAQRYAEALAELRAARRITGSPEHLPVEADCERALGRPRRALDVAASAETGRLDAAGRVELRIVAAGARRDLGQLDAAIVGLQGPDLQTAHRHPWGARLLYAYADALLVAGRRDEAVTWFVQAANADRTGETDAAERLADLEGVTFLDEEDDESDR
jgi:tetratricopeptide (TPR) repeat protein